MTNYEREISPVSMQALRRLPYYLNYLKSLGEHAGSISAPVIAKALNLNDVQVRKDLAAISFSGGKPKTGFVVCELIRDLEEYLGYNNVTEAILVGAGQLGKALLSYKGFDGYGLKIVAGFDSDDEIIGMDIGETKIFPIEKLIFLCQRLNVHIGIITVPAQQAQNVCDMLIGAGVLAIWNFAPVHLNVPDHIIVQNENMAASLAVLSKHLTEKLNGNPVV